MRDRTCGRPWFGEALQVAATGDRRRGIADAVDDGIGCLGLPDCGFQGGTAADIDAVGDDDERFASGDGVEFVARGGGNGVIEQGAGHGATVFGEAAEGDVAHAGEVVAEERDGRGEVAPENDGAGEAGQHDLVLGAEDVPEELNCGLFFGLNEALDAAADIEEEREGQGKIGFPREVADGLRGTVLTDLEIIFGEIGDERAAPVVDGAEDVDELDVHFDGGFRGGPLVLGEQEEAGEELECGHAGGARTYCSGSGQAVGVFGFQRSGEKKRSQAGEFRRDQAIGKGSGEEAGRFRCESTRLRSCPRNRTQSGRRGRAVCRLDWIDLPGRRGRLRVRGVPSGWRRIRVSCGRHGG